jgi:hypothetical protein
MGYSGATLSLAFSYLWEHDMSLRTYALLAAVIFAIGAVLQLMRAILGWSITVETTWGLISIPIWPNWIAFLAFGLLAWLGYTAWRDQY